MKIKCLKCNDIIESLSEHDFKKCKCGACFIDGGNPNDIVIIKDDGTEEKLNTNKK